MPMTANLHVRSNRPLELRALTRHDSSWVEVAEKGSADNVTFFFEDKYAMLGFVDQITACVLESVKEDNLGTTVREDADEE